MPNVNPKKRLPGSQAAKQKAKNISSGPSRNVRPSKSEILIDSFDRRWYRRWAGYLAKIDRALEKGKMDQEVATKKRHVAIALLLGYKRSLVDRQRCEDWLRFLASVNLPKDALAKLS